MNQESIISIQNASIFQHNVPIFQDINLEVEKGQFAYIIGKNGTGKTTLLKALYADVKPQSGEITVCGHDVKKIKSRHIPSLRRKIGIVFQNFQLLTDRNVYDNLRFVLRATGWNSKSLIDEQIHATLESVGLIDKIYAPVFRLSEGEQQRVGIARALINDPELILADEPTGNLDPITSEEIAQLLFNINKTKGTTVVVSTHDYTIIEKFRSRIICCEDKKIIEG